MPISNLIVNENDKIIHLVASHYTNRDINNPESYTLGEKWTVFAKKEYFIWCDQEHLSASFDCRALVYRIENYQLDPNRDISFVDILSHDWRGTPDPEMDHIGFHDFQRMVKNYFIDAKNPHMEEFIKAMEVRP